MSRPFGMGDSEEELQMRGPDPVPFEEAAARAKRTAGTHFEEAVARAGAAAANFAEQQMRAILQEAERAVATYKNIAAVAQQQAVEAEQKLEAERLANTALRDQLVALGAHISEQRELLVRLEAVQSPVSDRPSSPPAECRRRRSTSSSDTDSSAAPPWVTLAALCLFESDDECVLEKWGVDVECMKNGWTAHTTAEDIKKSLPQVPLGARVRIAALVMGAIEAARGEHQWSGKQNQDDESRGDAVHDDVQLTENTPPVRARPLP
jgi:hypothetical protein